MCDVFFSPKLSKCTRYSAQKIYNVHPIFRHFSDIKNVDDPNNQASFISCLLVNPQRTRISRLKEN